MTEEMQPPSAAPGTARHAGNDLPDLPCDVCRDLIPLVQDGAASPTCYRDGPPPYGALRKLPCLLAGGRPRRSPPPPTTARCWAGSTSACACCSLPPWRRGQCSACG